MVTQPPVDAEGFVGDPITLTVMGNGPVGAGTITYYWRKNGVTVMPAPNILGEQTSTLIINPATRDDAGSYDAVVINNCGFLGSSAATVRVFCRADVNKSGSVTVQDIFDFLAFYFGNQPLGDFNRSGLISVQDIFDFLAEYFAGCV
jgi:hypothetical protein